MENLHIAVVHGNEEQINTPLQYAPHDLCALLYQNKNNNIKAYFHPNHSYCKEATPGMDINNIKVDKTSTPKTTLLRVLQNAALRGGDKITSNGYGGNSKNIVQYIRCQCSQKYEGNTRRDGKYRQDSYVNNRRNNRNGATGANGIKRTDTALSRTKDNLCSFYLSLFQDENGFYVKSKNCNVFHRNHAKRNHIRQSSKNITASDRNSIRTGGKSCAATSINMNMHYIRNMERSNSVSILSQ